MPFYQERDIHAGAVVTDRDCEYCGTEIHPLELDLALNDGEHRRTKVRKSQAIGFVERLNRIP